ncbi:hypothetical protein CRG98_039308 [Punica granatum]|uniref:Uncharacterized protein n=1 Tax=Punica granatum TaxID=22663 RepID=A0A2I0I911_PUNGR|nr:hypothetical protein CRG98_039308 [Punica granatum]
MIAGQLSRGSFFSGSSSGFRFSAFAEKLTSECVYDCRFLEFFGGTFCLSGSHRQLKDNRQIRGHRGRQLAPIGGRAPTIPIRGGGRSQGTHPQNQENPQIGVIQPSPPIGVIGALCGLDSVQIKENVTSY